VTVLHLAQQTPYCSSPFVTKQTRSSDSLTAFNRRVFRQSRIAPTDAFRQSCTFALNRCAFRQSHIRTNRRAFQTVLPFRTQQTRLSDSPTFAPTDAPFRQSCYSHQQTRSLQTVSFRTNRRVRQSYFVPANRRALQTVPLRTNRRALQTVLLFRGNSTDAPSAVPFHHNRRASDSPSTFAPTDALFRQRPTLLSTDALQTVLLFRTNRRVSDSLIFK
jgi:hypothetical protein